MPTVPPHLAPVQETRTTPDPSNATLLAIDKAAKAERDFVIGEIRVLSQRMDGRDEAVKVLDASVHRTPTEIQLAISGQHALMLVELKRIEAEFKSVRELMAKEFNGVAALTAQKEEAAARSTSQLL